MGTFNFLLCDCLADCPGRINPYWKLALVFKCLTDNILLDDFKSVLQRLGDPKEDGTTAMLPESTNGNTAEKAVSAGHYEETCGEPSSRGVLGQSFDDFITAPDLDQTLEDSGNGYTRRCIESNSIGRVGVKIHKLPELPS